MPAKVLITTDLILILESSLTRSTAEDCEGSCSGLPPVEHGIYPARAPGPSPPEGPVDQAECGVAEALHDGEEDVTQPHRPRGRRLG